LLKVRVRGCGLRCLWFAHQHICTDDKKRVHRVSLRSEVRQNSANGLASAFDWRKPTAVGCILEAKCFERGDSGDALIVD
jgi:hypothetical protein